MFQQLLNFNDKDLFDRGVGGGKKCGKGEEAEEKGRRE